MSDTTCSGILEAKAIYLLPFIAAGGGGGVLTIETPALSYCRKTEAHWVPLRASCVRCKVHIIPGT